MLRLLLMAISTSMLSGCGHSTFISARGQDADYQLVQETETLSVSGSKGRRPAEESEVIAGEGEKVIPSFPITVYDLSDQVIPAFNVSHENLSIDVTILCSRKQENQHWSSFETCEELSSYGAAVDDSDGSVRQFPEVRIPFDKKDRRWGILITPSLKHEAFKSTHPPARFYPGWVFYGNRATDFQKLEIEKNLKELSLLKFSSKKVLISTRSGQSIEDWTVKNPNALSELTLQIARGASSPFKIAEILKPDYKTETVIEDQYVLVPRNIKTQYEKTKIHLDVKVVKLFIPFNGKIRKDIIPPAISVGKTLNSYDSIGLNIEFDDGLYSYDYIPCKRQPLCDRAGLNSLVFMGLTQGAAGVREGVNYCHASTQEKDLPVPVKSFLDYLLSLNTKVAGVFSSDLKTVFGSGFNLIVFGSRYGALSSAFASNGTLLWGVYPNWNFGDELESIYIHELGHFLSTPELATGLSPILKSLMQNPLFMETFADTLAIKLSGHVFGDVAVKRCEPRRVLEHQGYGYSRGYFDTSYVLRSVAACCKKLDHMKLDDPLGSNLCRSLKEDQELAKMFSRETLGKFDQSDLTQENFFNPDKPPIDAHQIGLPINSWLLNLEHKGIHSGIKILLDSIRDVPENEILAKASCSVQPESDTNLVFEATYPSIKNYFELIRDHLNRTATSKNFQEAMELWRKKKLEVGIDFGEQSSMLDLVEKTCKKAHKERLELGCSWNFLNRRCEKCQIHCVRTGA